MLIHFNGMPGVGKLTIAKIVSARLGAHLVDNHAIINAVYAAGCEHGSPEYLDTLEKITGIVYQGLVDNKVKDVVMTNALVDQIDVDVKRFDAVAHLADRREEPFVPVYLFCEVDENVSRVATPTRKDKKKLTDPEVLERILNAGYTIRHPDHHSYGLRLDVTHFTPEQSADAVLQHLTSLGLYHDPVASYQTPVGPVPRE